MKILTVVGARPQFIKSAAVSRALSQNTDMQEFLLHTGQHYDANMSEVFFDEMQLTRPHYHFSVTARSHGAMTAEMLTKIESVCLELKPDALMVFGDTNSTLAGALAASKLNIPLAHVEAGLRSFNMKMPEEINRILTDRVSTWLFCPTDTAVSHLKNEGFEKFKCRITKTGDVMYDAAVYYSKFSADKAEIFKSLNLKKFSLCTIHRSENTDSKARLSEIFSGLRAIGENKTVVLPLHPRTRKFVSEFNISTSGIAVIDPVGYFDMLELLKNCDEVITDSGGLQKEAYFFGKNCLILRNETEWTELLTEGHVLVDATAERIVNAFRNKNNSVSSNKYIYGKGDASEKISAELLRSL